MKGAALYRTVCAAPFSPLSTPSTKAFSYSPRHNRRPSISFLTKQTARTHGPSLPQPGPLRYLPQRLELGHKANNALPSQVMLRRVLVSSRPAAPSATPSTRPAATRSAPPCTASSAARPAPSRATPTPTPTSRRASSGTRRPSSSTSRTPRSTSPAPRWLSAVSRRRRTGTT